MTAARCIDCKRDGVLTARKASGKPLLCATHRRGRRTKRRDYSHDKHIGDTYGITTAEYNAIYAHQGGVCAICRRATGLGRRRLSVDHCHKTGLVRGLICSTDNKYLGHARDDVEALQRAIDYLRYPPAVDVIGVRITPDMADAISEADG